MQRSSRYYPRQLQSSSGSAPGQQDAVDDHAIWQQMHRHNINPSNIALHKAFPSFSSSHAQDPHLHAQDAQPLQQSQPPPPFEPSLFEDHWYASELDVRAEQGAQFLSELSRVCWGNTLPGAPTFPHSIRRFSHQSVSRSAQQDIQGSVHEMMTWLTKSSFPAHEGALPQHQEVIHAYVLQCGTYLMELWQKSDRWPTGDVWQEYKRLGPRSNLSSKAQDSFGPILYPLEDHIMSVICRQREYCGLHKPKGRLNITQQLGLFAPPFARGQGGHADILSPNTTVVSFKYRDLKLLILNAEEHHSKHKSSKFSRQPHSQDPASCSSTGCNIRSLQDFKSQGNLQDSWTFLSGEGTGMGAGSSQQAGPTMPQPGTRVYKPAHSFTLAPPHSDSLFMCNISSYTRKQRYCQDGSSSEFEEAKGLPSSPDDSLEDYENLSDDTKHRYHHVQSYNQALRYVQELLNGRVQDDTGMMIKPGIHVLAHSYAEDFAATIFDTNCGPARELFMSVWMPLLDGSKDAIHSDDLFLETAGPCTHHTDPCKGLSRGHTFV